MEDGGEGVDGGRGAWRSALQALELSAHPDRRPAGGGRREGSTGARVLGRWAMAQKSTVAGGKGERRSRARARARAPSRVASRGGEGALQAEERCCRLGRGGAPDRGVAGTRDGATLWRRGGGRGTKGQRNGGGGKGEEGQRRAQRGGARRNERKGGGGRGEGSGRRGSYGGAVELGGANRQGKRRRGSSDEGAERDNTKAAQR